MVILSFKVTIILSQGKFMNYVKKTSIFFVTRYRERIYHVKVLGGSSKIARYIETRYIERPLHGKRWGKNRDRTFLLVIEKTRYIETRYRERRLYLEINCPI